MSITSQFLRNSIGVSLENRSLFIHWNDLGGFMMSRLTPQDSGVIAPVWGLGFGIFLSSLEDSTQQPLSRTNFWQERKRHFRQFS